MLSNNDQFIHVIKVTASVLSDHNLVTAKCNIPTGVNIMTSNDKNNSISIKQLNLFIDKSNSNDIMTYLGSILDNKPLDVVVMFSLLGRCVSNTIAYIVNMTRIAW